MKASGVDILISAAFTGITSIVNRKAISRTDYLLGDGQRAPNRRAMGGLLCQAYIVVSHVPARRAER